MERRRSVAFRVALVACGVFVADRITKMAVAGWLSPDESIDLIDGVLRLTLVHNTGAAFGLWKGYGAIFIVVSVMTIALISLYVAKRPAIRPIAVIASGLIAGGAAGNLFDRIAYGHVIDFLDLRVWPVFNIADSCITIGVTIIAVLVARGTLTG